jgi:hypothetical protein
LGWQVFDDRIVDEIAKKAHVSRELIESLDERDQKAIQGLIGQLLAPKEIDAPGYLNYLKEVVLTLGHQGDVVIVGHAAEYLLPGRFGLNVRVIAPIEARIQRIADKAHLSLDAARVEIDKTDRRRVRAVRRNFGGQNVTAPISHDLTINTGAISLEAAAEIVVTALQQKLGVQIKASGR